MTTAGSMLSTHMLVAVAFTWPWLLAFTVAAGALWFIVLLTLVRSANKRSAEARWIRYGTEPPPRPSRPFRHGGGFSCPCNPTIGFDQDGQMMLVHDSHYDGTRP